MKIFSKANEDPQVVAHSVCTPQHRRWALQDKSRALIHPVLPRPCSALRLGPSSSTPISLAVARVNPSAFPLSTGVQQFVAVAWGIRVSSLRARRDNRLSVGPSGGGSSFKKISESCTDSQKTLMQEGQGFRPPSPDSWSTIVHTCPEHDDGLATCMLHPALQA